MENIDLHSLRVLYEIYKSGSLSRTAERLEVSQPAISLTLAKLRKRFDDPLFVRLGHEMRPSPMTDGLIHSVRESIVALEATLNYRVTFDPASTKRSIRIAMTDIGKIVILPKLLVEIGRQAPGARVEIYTISQLTAELLSAGEIDLAIGFVPAMPPSFYQKALYQEGFMCVSRTGHPRVRDHLTLELFQQEQHILVVTPVTGHLIVDRALEEQGIQRNIAVRIPNFLGLSALVGCTNYLCTLPRRAALILAEDPGVQAWPVPFRLPGYAVRQYWHERQASDPAHAWLRSVVTQLFGEDQTLS